MSLLHEREHERDCLLPAFGGVIDTAPDWCTHCGSDNLQYGVCIDCEVRAELAADDYSGMNLSPQIIRIAEALRDDVRNVDRRVTLAAKIAAAEEFARRDEVRASALVTSSHT
jgi:hypothetical protein